MKFDEYYDGWEFEWLCLDSKGHIGVFSTWGRGPVPESILDILPLFEGLLERLNVLPVVGEAMVTPQAEQALQEQKRRYFSAHPIRYLRALATRLLCALRKKSLHEFATTEVDLWKDMPHITPSLDPARRGLFSFDWALTDEDYSLIAAPEKPLLIDAISDQQWADLAIKTVLPLARKSVLPVDFQTVESIPPDITEN